MGPSWKASDPVQAFLFIGRKTETQKSHDPFEIFFFNTLIKCEAVL